MRISTTEYYASSVQTMNNQEAQLAQLTQELSSGNALTTPAENPLGAAQAVSLSMSSATLTQYTTNQNSALSSLQLEDSTLSSVTSVMQSISSLIVEAGNQTLSDSDRSAMAQQLQGYVNQLQTLANTTNGAGNYIFAGSQATTQPFTLNASGGVSYNGDTGQNFVQVAGTQQIATGDSGQSVFLSVPAQGTSAVPAGSSSNTGTGTISAVAVTNPAATTNTDSYTITFGGTAAAPTYTVTDNTAVPPTTSTPTAYTSGSPVQVNLGTGMNVTISGTPSIGDTFSVTPATSSTNSNLFATLNSIVTALQTPTNGTTSGLANLTNALTAGTTAFQNSMTNLTTVQASVGGREQQLEALQTSTANASVQTQSNLSNVTSANMVTTISQYEQLQDSLEAAQKTFVQIEGMSLFQYINT